MCVHRRVSEAERASLSVRPHAGMLHFLNVKLTHIQQQLTSQHLTHISPTDILFQHTVKSGIGKPIAITIEYVIVSFCHHIKKWQAGQVCHTQITITYTLEFLLRR